MFIAMSFFTTFCLYLNSKPHQPAYFFMSGSLGPKRSENTCKAHGATITAATVIIAIEARGQQCGELL